MKSISITGGNKYECTLKSEDGNVEPSTFAGEWRTEILAVEPSALAGMGCKGEGHLKLSTALSL